MTTIEAVELPLGTPSPEPPRLENKVAGASTPLSPLRYPGAKGKLAPYVAEALRLNGLKPKLFVEPFAGGAAVSLHLLQAGLVDQIGLAEKDPLLASFWQTVFDDHEWLVEKIETTPATIETWKALRALGGDSRREMAFACIFLNRTSFSGILSKTAGPLGGYGQVSKYKIHCRYYRDTIIRRIRDLAKLKDRVAFVRQADWKEALSLPSSLGYEDSDVFYYLDPPFYNKAARLYRFYFQETEHEALRDQVIGLKSPYLLSYDPAEAILSLYSCNGSTPKKIELLYTISAKGPAIKAEELIISSLRNLPHTIGNLSVQGGPAQAVPVLEQDRTVVTYGI